MNLEHRYRRWTRLFPAAWRRTHEDELIGTLLDHAAPGQTSVSLGDAADLVRGAAVLHGRSLRSRRGWQVLMAALVTAAVVAVVGTSIGVSNEFLITSLVVAAVPGTGVFFTVSTAIGGGWQRGLVAAVGCTLGVVPHLVAAMLGLSGVMQVGATVFEVVRYVGVAYLLVMGWSMIRAGSDLLADDRGEPPLPVRSVVGRGVLVNLLNPKLTLFFFAFLPQFLDGSPGLVDGRLLTLSAVFMLSTFVVFAIYAAASAALRERVLGAPAARRWFQRVLGSLLIGFGLKLAVSDH